MVTSFVPNMSRSLATKATKLTEATEVTEATDPPTTTMPTTSKQTKLTTRAAKLVDDGFTTTSSTSATSTIGFTKPMVNPTSSNLKIDRHGLNGLHSGGLGETGPGKLTGDDPEAAASFGFKNLSDPTEATVWIGGLSWSPSVSLQCIQVINMSLYIHYVVMFGRDGDGRDGDLHLHVFQAFLAVNSAMNTWEEQKKHQREPPQNKQTTNTNSQFHGHLDTTSGFWL